MPTLKLSGCAILKNGKLLLIRKKDRDFWEIPGGRDSDGSSEEAAVSKTAEQIGVTPTVIQQFTVLEYQKDGTNVEANIFECDVDPEAAFTPGENVEEVRWFSREELKGEKVGSDVEEILEELPE
ncbi:NUDIX domain-containing protein [Candidatus Woesearchaeota archaeon]|nr:NUDIX domain-containing protein [Candidatus Woesearchaeota archaeon]